MSSALSSGGYYLHRMISHSISFCIAVKIDMKLLFQKCIFCNNRPMGCIKGKKYSVVT